MNNELIPEFINRYNRFKQTEEYDERINQLELIPIFRDIIKATIDSGNLNNDKLTGLIQMFKPNVTEETFEKYLQICIPNNTINTQLAERWFASDQFGMTGAGLNSVSGLTASQLKKVGDFISNAFTVKDKKQAKELCSVFDKNEIPYIKSGVYSPWLYYINPEIFPILNNTHTNFRKWLKIPADYPTCVEDFNQLKDEVKETDFGLIDRFAHHFDENGPIDPVRVLNLNGNRLFKISHGHLVKNASYRKTGVIGILESNNWITMNKNTGHSQGKKFVNYVRPGDYVYLVNGNKLMFIAKILSDAKDLPKSVDDLIDADGMWIYREIKPLFYPVNNSINDLKEDERFFMPSGFSTFYEVPQEKEKLDYLNENLFKPKFNVKVIANDSSVDFKDPIMENKPLNTILYGPPGTGKTYNSIFYALANIENKKFSEIEAESKINFNEVKRRYDNNLSEGIIVFTTFHQSMGYEDFIEGIKPKTENNQVIYKVEDGIFKGLCNTATAKVISNFENSYQAFLDELSSKEEGIKLDAGKDTIGISLMENGFDLKIDSNSYIKSISKAGLKYVSDSQSFVGIWGKYYKAIFKNLADNYGYKTESTDLNQKYVLIIDEINRGNVSQIFGELITLIEEDKRSDGKVAFKVTLPYSKKPFEIPNNIYIIGTMNTADRSVEALDTALRRRFSFISMMPKEDTLQMTTDGIDLPKLLLTINNRLRVLKENDHTIGHAWLWDVTNFEGLKTVFGNKILPLLQEYFYNDYEKLGLVLGDAFFRKHQMVNSDLFASFTGGNGLAGQYGQTYQYELKSMNELTIEDFKSLEKTIKPIELDEE